MRGFELNRKQVFAERDWPLRSLQVRVDVQLDLAGEVPTKAARRMALEALRSLLEDAKDEDLNVLSSPLHAVEDASPLAEAPKTSWEKPEYLDLRVIKSAHRVITEVAKRGLSGRAVLASDLVGAIGLSAPTLGRLLREGEPGHEYLSRYVQVTPQGRTRALDLKPEGRLLASKIRAGSIPS